MSMIAFASSEMRRAGFADSDIAAMEQILTIFYDTWDSGGAVWAMAPVLQRCIAGKPLSLLTGHDDEWTDVSEYSGEPMWQNKRCGTVFKNHERAYDIDVQGRPTITFPYSPEKAVVPSPVIVFDDQAAPQEPSQ